MVFTFEPKWKEELHVTGPGGTFCLFLPMGVLTACLPSEKAWQSVAPAWARNDWAILHEELRAWCTKHQARLEISDTALVWTEG
ncbi:MAG: hypothetical protein U1E15_00505 [Hyphomicrobiales bacterium]